MRARRPQRQLTTLLVFALCLGTVALGSPFPELTLKDQTGTAQTLSAYRGKIIVLNFWATWCGPCREELPRLDELAREYASKDVVFFAVSLDDAETQSKIAPFLEKKKISTIPIWIGASPVTLQQFQLGEVVPATVILDRNGDPTARIMGEASRKDITSRLDWVLNGQQGKPPKSLLKNF